jgi:CheY-like chemotaxis protein
MDVHLGGMSGIEAARTLRSGSLTHAIPVVAFTGDTDAVYADPRANLLFHSVLQKPSAPMKVIRHIRSIIGEP